MIGTPWVRLALWLCASAGALAAGQAALGPLAPAEGAATTAVRLEVTGPLRPYPAESLARQVVARDLFRVGRRPAAVAFDPEHEVAVAVPPETPPKPVLRLVGLMEGAAPQALIEGLPGVESARALGVGESAAGLRVSEIHNGLVRVVGMDTVWLLMLRRP